GLLIYGVEITQATQYFDSPNRIDNSIRLVVNKPAYVRVYVRSNHPDALPHVTGTATLQRPYLKMNYYRKHLTRVNPNSVTARAKQVDAYGFPIDERGDRDYSLNFIIPAEDVRGPMHLKIRVEAQGTDYHDETELKVDASLLQTLRVCGISLAYTGPAQMG